MGELFDKILKSDESIFLNPQFLDYDYQPKLIPFRETQQQQIATSIKPLLQRRNGKNVVVVGKPGVGKTVSLKHVLNELKDDYGDEVFCLYVNCWKRDTSFKIISDICQQVNYKWTHGKNFDELLEAAAEIINEKSIVVVLDEADKLQDHNIIYNILEDFHRRGIILITNDNGFLAKIDARIRSRLIPDILEFKPYNLEQTSFILKQRAEYAFVSGTLDEDSLNIIVKKTFELGDIRAGLFLLKQSGEIAENKSSKKITIEFVQEAMISLIDLDKDLDLDSLLEIIKENTGKNKNDLFKIYEEKCGKSIRTFQRKINELEKLGRIKHGEEVDESGFKQTVIQYLD